MEGKRSGLKNLIISESESLRNRKETIKDLTKDQRDASEAKGGGVTDDVRAGLKICGNRSCERSYKRILKRACEEKGEGGDGSRDYRGPPEIISLTASR